MSKSKLVFVIAISGLIASIGQNSAMAGKYLPPDTSMVDGMIVHAPTRVQAGKYFQVKLTSRKGKFSGICWWNWDVTHGISAKGDFAVKNGVGGTKALPLQPGAATLSFTCGTSRGNAIAGGNASLYIAP